MKMLGKILIGTWLVFTMSNIANAKSRFVEIKIDNIRSNSGKIVLIAFGDKTSFDQFNYDKAVGYAEVKAQKGLITKRVEIHQNEKVAIFAYHDEDDNDDLKMKNNIPLEGFGLTGMKQLRDDLTFEQSAFKGEKSTLKLFYLK